MEGIKGKFPSLAMEAPPPHNIVGQGMDVMESGRISPLASPLVCSKKPGEDFLHDMNIEDNCYGKDAYFDSQKLKNIINDNDDGGVHDHDHEHDDDDDRLGEDYDPFDTTKWREESDDESTTEACAIQKIITHGDAIRSAGSSGNLIKDDEQFSDDKVAVEIRKTDTQTNIFAKISDKEEGADSDNDSNLEDTPQNTQDTSQMDIDFYIKKQKHNNIDKTLKDTSDSREKEDTNKIGDGQRNSSSGSNRNIKNEKKQDVRRKSLIDVDFPAFQRR